MSKLSIKDIPEKAIERFFSKFEKGTIKDCWEWQGQKDKDGYGKFNYRIPNKGFYVRAHRISASYYLEEVPDDKVVMHKCDNPSCVNPNHLKIGTHLENEQDKDAKGRRPLDHLIKYSIEDAVSVFKLVLAGKFTKEISEITGITRQAIQHIYSDRLHKGTRYYSVYDKFSKKQKTVITDNIINRGERSTSSKFTEKDILEIRMKHILGNSNKIIANKYGTKGSYVASICKKQKWKHLKDPDCYRQPVCNIYGESFGCPEKCAGYMY